jgi:hypothetical protein
MLVNGQQVSGQQVSGQQVSSIPCVFQVGFALREGMLCFLIIIL